MLLALILLSFYFFTLFCALFFDAEATRLANSRCNFRISFALISFILGYTSHFPTLQFCYIRDITAIVIFNRIFRWQSPIISASDHFVFLSLRAWQTSPQHKHHRTRWGTSSLLKKLFRHFCPSLNLHTFVRMQTDTVSNLPHSRP